MWIILERTFVQIRSRLLRFHSECLQNLSTTINLSDALDSEIKHVTKSLNTKNICNKNLKSLRIAILGLPNVGKSTLINELVGRPVCAASSKVQTTVKKSDAVYVDGNVQLIFIDTPGLVTNHELKKYNLNDAFQTDPNEAMTKADIVGVVQDASHSFAATKIDERVLILLKHLREGTPSILILNKVDKIKEKRKLLEIVKILTSESGWPNFSDIFMISALKADGIDDLRNYLVDSAKLKDWEYSHETISNESQEKLIEGVVRAKFMDALNDELPYRIKTVTEHIGVLDDGSMSVLVSVTCSSDRISFIILGRSGKRVKQVAQLAEQELCQIFRTAVRLKIEIKFKEPKTTEEPAKRWRVNK